MQHRMAKLSIWGALGLAAALLLTASLPAADGEMVLTATTANVSGAPDEVRIEILRWSTDQERQRLLDAWDLKVEPGAGEAGAKGKAAAKGKAPAKGKGRGSGGPDPEPLTPELALGQALQEAATVGYLWSSERAGYALRYAGHVANSDGSQRLILVTDRPLGQVNQLWKPTTGVQATAYEFSVIELRLDANGNGEGKASLTGTVASDPAAQFIALENYSALPVILADVGPAAD